MAGVIVSRVGVGQVAGDKFNARSFEAGEEVNRRAIDDPIGGDQRGSRLEAPHQLWPAITLSALYLDIFGQQRIGRANPRHIVPNGPTLRLDSEPLEPLPFSQHPQIGDVAQRSVTILKLLCHVVPLRCAMR